MAFLSSMLIIAFGAMFQFSLFLHNDFGILFFSFFLFQARHSYWHALKMLATCLPTQHAETQRHCRPGQ